MKDKRKVIFTILEVIFIVLIIYSGYNIFKWHIENKNTSKVLEEISNSVTVDENNNTTINFNTLKAKNADTIGFIKVNGTNINYPVVKSNDNDYYLTHSYDKSVSGAGWIFADYRNKLDGTDKNLIIYGHNRRDGSMFSTLKNILNPEWYENEENRIVTFITEQENAKYEVFSAYQIEDEDYYLGTSFGGHNSFTDFIKKIKSRSVNDFGVDVQDTDSILTLSTCANDNNYRVVLHAKKLEAQGSSEDISDFWNK